MKGLRSRLRRLLAPWADPFARGRMRLLRFARPGWRVLDAGCGDGAMALRLARRGCQVVGLTNDRDVVERARAEAERLGLAEQVAFVVHDLRAGPPPGGGFDAAVCFDVLEHILDDRAALGNVVAAVRPGGLVAITVPDRSAPPIWGDRVSPVEDGSHVRQGYTTDELRSLVEGAGLEAVQWGRFGGPLARAWTGVWRRLAARGGGMAALLRAVWVAIMWVVCWLDRLVPGKRYEMFVLARKSGG